MVEGVLALGFWLLLPLLGSSPPAAPGPPRYLRTQLDDDSVSSDGPSPARHIRSSLEDASHASFPLESEGRVIRISLDDNRSSYGHLGSLHARARIVRTTLD